MSMTLNPFILPLFTHRNMLTVEYIIIGPMWYVHKYNLKKKNVLCTAPTPILSLPQYL